MTIGLILMIIILLAVILIQHRRYSGRGKQIMYITHKLQNIVDNQTDEQILLLTGDRKLIALILEMNRLLDHHKQWTIRYSRNERAMKKMLSNISHDLKTPLTVVLGYLESIIGDGGLSREEQQELLIKVENRAKDLLNLLNQFFHLAKLESFDAHYPISKININEVCRKNILSFYDILTRKGMEVSIHIPEENLFAAGNEEALDRILNNLISNAVKYGSDGNVIGLTLFSDEAHVYVEVWDKGSGIDGISADRVFERLYSVENKNDRSNPGSGLGLAITQKLVENLGGEITLRSVPYEKTVFTFYLNRMTD